MCFRLSTVTLTEDGLMVATAMLLLMNTGACWQRPSRGGRTGNPRWLL